MASKQELRALITIAGKIDPSLQSAMLKASGESMKLSKNMKQSADGMKKVGIIAKGAFLGNIAASGLTALGGKVLEIGASGLS